MESVIRRSGIDAIGDVSWGTHFCQFYESSQDLIETLVPYFMEGLAANEFCMWVTSEPLQVDQATAALRAAVPDLEDYIAKGQIEILDYSQWYTRSGKFSADEVLQGWIDKLKAALEKGYDGLRLTGNTFWLEQSDWDDFTRYEEAVNNVIGQYRMLAICTYCLQKCSALEILDVVTNHQFALIKRSGRWQIIKSSEQLKAAKAFQESEQRYATTLASIGDAVIATDIDSKITFMNAVAEKLTGWTLHEATMLPVTDVFNIINEYTRERVDDPVAKVLELGAIVGLANHTVLICRDGTEVAIDDSGAPIKDSNDKIVGVVLVFRDITERKRAEEELQLANERLGLAQRASGAGVWDWDITTGQIEWSSELFELFGLDPQKDIASFEVWNSVLHPEDLEIAGLRIDQALKEHTGLNSEYRIIRPDGQVKWINALGHGAYDRQGSPVRMIGICIDITQRVLAKRALIESEEKYRNLVENANSIIIRMDQNGVITFFNNYAQKFFGYSLDEIIGQNVRIIVPPNESKSNRNMEEMTQNILIDPDDFVENINENIRKNGERIWVSWRNRAIRDGNGDIVGNLAIGQDITDRRQMEEALQESEKRYRTLFDGMSEGFALHEIICNEKGEPCDYRFIEVNPAFERLTGMKRQDVIGRTELQLFPDDDPHRIGIYGAVALQGQPIQFETYSKKLGRYYEVFAHSPASGQFAALFLDITARKQAEEGLLQSQSMLAQAEMIANIGSWMWDLKSGELIWSGQAYRIFGREMGQYIPTYKSFLDHILPEYRQLMVQEVDRSLSGEKACDIEYPIATPSSAIRWVHALGEVFFDRNGQPLSMIGTVLDITERKEAEEALRRSEERARARSKELELVLDSVPAAIWIAHDPQALQITGNKLSYNWLRLSPGANASKSAPEGERPETFRMFRNGKELRAEEMPVQLSAMGKEIRDYEFTFVYTDGNERYVLGNSVPLLSDDGKPRGSVSSFIDITKRKEAEEALHKANDELELKVRERTFELQNAKEAAEAAAEAKSTFLANMSHELRTPMNAVIGFTSLLLDEDLSFEHREFIEGIRNGGEAMVALINDILDFSRADKKKIELDHRPISLRHCVEEALDMVAMEADKKGLNLAYTICYGTPDTIVGDHGRIRQILVNLLSNAVKFTDSGDVSVSISSQAIEGNKRQIFFSVKDTGIGIPQDKLGKIFEPFTQLERTISRKREGVGLGLAITKNLVELMGGTIWAESITGQGTIFHVKILAEIIPGKQLDIGDADKKSLSKCMVGKKALRILVAEDNPSNQKVLVEMLKRMGYRPDAVADGREVIQALERLPYDLILMDVRMPEMDGITATQVIRKLRPNGPKVVAITAYALEGDRDKCLEAGMDDYLSKPVQKKELEAVLMKYSEESA